MSSRAAASASWMAVRASLRAWAGSTASVRDASRAERAASKGSALVSDMILREAQRGAERRSRRRGIEQLVDAAGSRAAKGKNVSAQAGPWLVRLAGDRVQVSAEELWSNFFSLFHCVRSGAGRSCALGIRGRRRRVESCQCSRLRWLGLNLLFSLSRPATLQPTATRPRLSCRCHVVWRLGCRAL